MIVPFPAVQLLSDFWRIHHTAEFVMFNFQTKPYEP